MAFGNMNERGARRPIKPAAPTLSAPVIPAPPATPGGLKPNIAVEKPLRSKPVGNRPAPAAPAGGIVPKGQRPPDPTKDALPPQFANMVKGGMNEAMARQKWARSLQNRGKAGAGIPGAPTAPPPGVKPPPAAPGGGVTATPGAPAGGVSNPFVPSPAPAPGTPVFGGFGGGMFSGSPGGGSPGGGQGYPGMPQPGGPGSPIMPGGQDFRDPMMSFLSAVPLMNLNMRKQIDDAMGQSGMTGNRWSTSAQNTAGQIGAENALAQNAMFTNALTGYANDQENRALQASGMGMQLGQMFDQQAQDRVKLPFQIGAYEQGRQDDFSKMAYDDFDRNRLGWLPTMLSAASGQSGGSSGTLVPVPGQPAKPGAADYMTLLAQLFG